MNEADELNEFERKIVQNVAEFGCQVNHVFDPDGNDPAFSYSVGFPTTVNQPEVIVFGLSNDLMHAMIMETLDQCRSGLVLEDGIEIEGLLEGHKCVCREIDRADITYEHFNSAMWFERHENGSSLDRAMQLVWPGAKQGLFPWDQGCDPYVIEMQPPLYRKTVH